MAVLKRGDVIVTAFPFAEGHATKVRPAVVWRGPWHIDDVSICWILMVTSSLRRHWPGDVYIQDAISAGLPKTSLIRTLKITCIDTANIIQKIGTLDPKTLRAVEKQMRVHLQQKNR